jgi:hypothetical protein
MDNRVIFLYHVKALNMGGHSRVGRPAVGSAGAKLVGVEVGVKRPAELRSDGEPLWGGSD